MILAENLKKTDYFTVTEMKYEGGLMCVLSPQSKDKNAFLRTVCGYFSADSGILDTDLDNIAYVSKGAPIPKNLTVKEYLEFLMRSCKAVQASEDILQVLDDVYDKTFGSLTNYQRMRAAILCEMAVEPQCLIIEEPSYALSYDEADKIYALIEELSQRVDIIFATDKVSEMRIYADLALVMLDGQQLYFGETDQLFEKLDENGVLTVKLKGKLESIEQIFMKYDAEITPLVRKDTYKCVLTADAVEREMIRKEVVSAGMAILEMKADGDSLKKMISVMEQKEEEQRLDYEEAKVQEQVVTLDQLKDNMQKTDEDEMSDSEDGPDTQQLSDGRVARSGKANMSSLFYHDEDDEDDDDGQ